MLAFLSIGVGELLVLFILAAGSCLGLVGIGALVYFFVIKKKPPAATAPQPSAPPPPDNKSQGGPPSAG